MSDKAVPCVSVFCCSFLKPAHPSNKSRKKIKFHENKSLPAHIEGVAPGVFYTYDGTSFQRRMTLEVYEAFKEQLARISGFESESLLLASENPAFFKELVNWGSSSGTIGPIVSQKLYQDFKTARNDALKHFAMDPQQGEGFLHLYNEFFKIFATAKNSGAVVFQNFEQVLPKEEEVT